jgi:hypothetical protein
MFPRDMVCLTNISVDTLHKGDTEDADDDDDDDGNNNNSNNSNNNANICNSELHIFHSSPNITM